MTCAHSEFRSACIRWFGSLAINEAHSADLSYCVFAGHTGYFVGVLSSSDTMGVIYSPRTIQAVSIASIVRNITSKVMDDKIN